MAATRISLLSFDRPIIEQDGSLTAQSRAYFKTVTDRALIIGTGNPDAIVEAEQGAQYMDDAGTAGNILYIKQVADIGGDKSLGWVLV